MNLPHFSKELVLEATDIDAAAIKANRATTKVNSERWQQNHRRIEAIRARTDICEKAKLAEIRSQRFAHTPLPHQTPVWVKECLNAETANTQFLGDRTPDLWAELVGEIQDRVLRGAVASIVWWDYFAHRESPQRWPHLDMFLLGASASAVQDEVLEAGLLRVGYTPYAAWNRSVPAKQYVRTHRARAA